MLPNLYACFLILQYNIRPLFEHVTSRAVLLSDRRMLSQNRERCNDRLFNFVVVVVDFLCVNVCGALTNSWVILLHFSKEWDI